MLRLRPSVEHAKVRMHEVPHGLKRAAAAVATLAAAYLSGVSGAPVRAADIADFYRGKTVTVVIGYSAGGGYDVFGRLLAQHMGRHIPGNPALVPQNMPGAGSRKAGMFL